MKPISDYEQRRLKTEERRTEQDLNEALGKIREKKVRTALEKEKVEYGEVCHWINEQSQAEFLQSLITATKETGVEHGCTICKDPSGFHFGKLCVGDSCSVHIEKDTCTSESKYMGKFHTHPTAINEKRSGNFSSKDILNALTDGSKISCLGTTEALGCLRFKVHEWWYDKKWYDDSYKNAFKDTVGRRC
jgi:hypothetical protein